MREALESHRRVLGDEHPSTLYSIHEMGSLLLSQGEPAEAEPYFREALETRGRVMPEGHWTIWHTQSLLGRTLTGQSRFVAAEAMLVEAAERIEPPEQWRQRTDEAIERVVALYTAWHAAQPDGGYADKAAEWRAKLPTEQEAVASDPPPPADAEQDE